MKKVEIIRIIALVVLAFVAMWLLPQVIKSLMQSVWKIVLIALIVFLIFILLKPKQKKGVVSAITKTAGSLKTMQSNKNAIRKIENKPEVSENKYNINKLNEF